MELSRYEVGRNPVKIRRHSSTKPEVHNVSQRRENKQFRLETRTSESNDNPSTLVFAIRHRGLKKDKTPCLLTSAGILTEITLAGFT